VTKQKSYTKRFQNKIGRRVSYQKKERKCGSKNESETSKDHKREKKQKDHLRGETTKGGRC